MTAPRLIADEDFRRDIVQAAIRRFPALDFITVQEIGLSGLPDAAILEFAFESGRILVSHDRNTMTAAAMMRLANGEGMAGLIIIAQNASRPVVAEHLAMIAGASEAEEWVAVIEFLPW